MLFWFYPQKVSLIILFIILTTILVLLFEIGAFKCLICISHYRFITIWLCSTKLVFLWLFQRWNYCISIFTILFPSIILHISFTLKKGSPTSVLCFQDLVWSYETLFEFSWIHFIFCSSIQLIAHFWKQAQQPFVSR